MGVERRVFDSMDDELHKLREIRCDYKSDPLCVSRQLKQEEIYLTNHILAKHIV